MEIYIYFFNFSISNLYTPIQRVMSLMSAQTSKELLWALLQFPRLLISVVRNAIVPCNNN